ncbi:hypothetical protein TNCV_5006251 [Trichonephila clavipes]|uniref:Uncharacterized protein n=1 Tax=Trichonephila clavipes TaxID=2585209 RepID=A0A8X6SGC8_TRICX|nr:hypothetical protein TNCV_5006251 [Trichonephila clavipes]
MNCGHDSRTMNVARHIDVFTRFMKGPVRTTMHMGFYSQQCSPSLSQYLQTVPGKKRAGCKLNIHHSYHISILQTSSNSHDQTRFERKEIRRCFWHAIKRDESFKLHLKRRHLAKFQV